MSISQTLLNAASGLGAVSRQASVASQNIANALTPGYVRREASLAELAISGVGAGVRVAGVLRGESPALTSDRRAAETEAAGVGARADAIEKIIRLIGGPEDAGSLFRKVSAFDQTLRSLANSPESVAAQQSVVTAAKELVGGIRSIAQSYQDIRAEADRGIALQVESVNAALKGLERINEEVGKGTAAGRDVSALLDERDRLLDQINESIPVRPLVRENGKIDLITSEGVVLISGSARTITFTSAPTITPSRTLSAGTLSGLSVDGIDITPGSGSRASADGAIAGLFFVRDAAAPNAANELDEFAVDLISRFETAGLDPTTLPGDPGLLTDGGAALAPPIAAGIALRISLNAVVDPGQGGSLFKLRDGLGATTPGPVSSNQLLQGLVAVLNEPRSFTVAGGRNVSALEAAGVLGGNAAAAFADVDAAVQSTSAFLQLLKEAELGETGVDTDAELQNLLVIEQAYAANARVIETVGQLIDQLIEI